MYEREKYLQMRQDEKEYMADEKEDQRKDDKLVDALESKDAEIKELENKLDGSYYDNADLNIQVKDLKAALMRREKALRFIGSVVYKDEVNDKYIPKDIADEILMLVKVGLAGEAD